MASGAAGEMAGDGFVLLKKSRYAPTRVVTAAATQMKQANRIESRRRVTRSEKITLSRTARSQMTILRRSLSGDGPVGSCSYRRKHSQSSRMMTLAAIANTAVHGSLWAL